MEAHFSHLQILTAHQKLSAPNHLLCRFILQVSLYIKDKERYMKKSYVLYGISGVLIGAIVILLINAFFINKGEHSVRTSKINPTEDKIFLSIQIHSSRKAYSYPHPKEKNSINDTLRYRIYHISRKNPSSDDIVLLAEHEPYYYTLKTTPLKNINYPIHLLFGIKEKIFL